MDLVTKSVDATVNPVESENPNGEFEVVLSTEALDRDGEHLWIDEWKTPLPARIHIDGDHGRTLEKTVGSAVPRIEGNKLIGKGVYAGTPYAQMVRQLVNEGHIGQVSVTYGEKKNQKDGKTERELFNAAFVAVPANPEAVVLSSKAADEHDSKFPYGKDVHYADPGYRNGVHRYPLRNADEVRSAWDYFHHGRDRDQYTDAQKEHIENEIESAAKEFGVQLNKDEVARDNEADKSIGSVYVDVVPRIKADGGLSASGDNPVAPDTKHDAMVQAIHDAAFQLGAECINMADVDPGVADGGNKSVMRVVTKDARQVVAGLDATLDEAAKMTAGVDRSNLPEPVAQALDLLVAAQESAGKLMDLMGVYDPDNPTNTSSNSAGSPQESAEDSAAAAKAAAADESAEAVAAKAKEAEKARALAFLISQNSLQRG